MKKYLDSEGVKFLWKDIIKPYINNYVNNLKDSQIIVSDNFEGAENDKGARYVVRQNKLIAILKDGHVEYAPEGIAFVDAIEPTSFSIGDKVYNVPAGVSYVELGLTEPITGNDMYNKVLYQNTGIRGFGLYLDGSKNNSLGDTFALAADLEWLDISGMDTKAVTFGINICNKSAKLRRICGKWQLPKVELASNAFISCSALEDVDVSEAGMDKCRDLGSMFKGCSSLTALDVSAWNTAACTTMQGMFYGCSSLTSLDVSGCDTSACTDMSFMFNGCSSLTSLDISNWNTGACTNMNSMFYGCSSLTSLDVSNWNTAACTDMSSMFSGCSSLTTLDVSGWNTAACTNMQNMFNGCSSLTTLDVSGWNTGLVANFYRMFRNVAKLESLDCSKWDVKAATSFDSMFRGCLNLTTLKLGGFENDLVTMTYCMFERSAKIMEIDITGLNPQNVTDCYGMFLGCLALVTLKFPQMGKLKANNDRNSIITLSNSPLGTAGEESRQALLDLFSCDRVANGLTNTLTVILSTVSKTLLTPEEIAAITAKGYTIA